MWYQNITAAFIFWPLEGSETNFKHNIAELESSNGKLHLSSKHSFGVVFVFMNVSPFTFPLPVFRSMTTPGGSIWIFSLLDAAL